MVYASPQAGLRYLFSWSSSAEEQKDVISGMDHPVARPWKMDWCSGEALL